MMPGHGGRVMKALLVVASLAWLIVGPLVAGITAAPAPRPQAGQAAKAVDYKLLIALLPDIPGWEKDEATGDQSEMMGMTFSRAEVAYNKGDVNVMLEITDTALIQGMLMPFAM